MFENLRGKKSTRSLKRRIDQVKMPSFITAVAASTFLALCAPSHAGPRGVRFGGSAFHNGLVARSRMPGINSGVRRNFVLRQNQPFLNRRNHFFFQPLVGPVLSPFYGYPDDYLTQDPGLDGGYDTSSVSPGSNVVIINNNPWPVAATAATGQVKSGYDQFDAEARMGRSVPAEKSGEMAEIPVPAPVQRSPQTNAKATQAKAPAGTFNNLVLVSWLKDAGRDVIYVQNTETNEVQKITSEPNLDHFRIVELHPDADPQQAQAVISNGSEQGAVRFRF
jgi:hypothetical protein